LILTIESDLERNLGHISGSIRQLDFIDGNTGWILGDSFINKDQARRSKLEQGKCETPGVFLTVFM
jgi:hypothetical protein